MSAQLETSSIIVSVNAGAQTILIIMAGAYLKIKGHISDEGIKTMNNITINFFLPALLFADMLSSLKPSELGTIGITFLFVLEHMFIGTLIGIGLGYATCSNANLRRLMGMCCAFQNVTAIPLLYIQVLGTDSFTDDDHDFSSRGTMYVLCYSIFASLFKWSYAYNILRPETAPNTAKSTFGMKEVGQDDDLRSHASTPMLEEDRLLLANASVPNPVDEDIVRHFEKKQVSRCEKFKTELKKYVNMPVIAAIIAIPLALIPYVNNDVFVGSGAVFNGNIVAALHKAGSCAIVIILVILGSSLSEGFPKNADIETYKVVTITIARLFLMPSIGIAICWPLYNAGVIDRVLALVIMLMHSCPTSAQLLMICSHHQHNVENIAKIYLVVYIISPFSMMGFAIIILNILY